jgi:RNA polymerase sigma-70 factor, ECF subfamily
MQPSPRLVRTRRMRQHASRMPVPDRSEDEQRWSAWMARAVAGDREAYAKLMAELADVVESYLRARFGALRASDFLEDCVQEALLALHRVRHTWDPGRPFRPWMFAVVRHKVIDLLRRSELRRSELAPAQEPAGSEPDPAHRLDSARLLEALEPGDREALVLTKLEGYSLEEAAARVGVSPAAMKSRVHRAVQRVQKRLREEDLS